MNTLIGFGKYLFAVPMVVFGIMHFMAAKDMAAMAPGGVFMVYLTGIALIAAGISIILGKLDKLASCLLGIMLLLFILPHAQNLASNEMEMINILKNIALAGGAFMYASIAKDSTYIK
jgi:putative oxidoreductase